MFFPSIFTQIHPGLCNFYTVCLGTYLFPAFLLLSYNDFNDSGSSRKGIRYQTFCVICTFVLKVAGLSVTISQFIMVTSKFKHALFQFSVE